MKLILQTSPSSPLLPPPPFHLRKTSCQSCSLEEIGGNQPARKQSHVLTSCSKKKKVFLSFAISQAAQNATQSPFICFGAGLNSLFRRSGGIVCARIFACGLGQIGEDSAQCWQKIVVAITEKPKGSGLCQGLNKAWGLVPDIPSLVCVCACVFVSGDWWSAGRLGLEARSSRWWQHQAW